jgi:hypothetical protein
MAVLVKDLFTSEGDHVIVILAYISREEDFLQDVEAEIRIKTGGW